MFARRGSSLSLEKLPCLYIVSLTCCLLAIGHVSSMSLDRLGRQYQQQNDKQLQLSEFMLPEAESEMLQSDMELVPDFGGNSDMYLLVPATAVSREKNLQSLTEISESQNSANSAESNSDLLMLESEYTPAMQISKLPENNLETNVDEKLIGSNELNRKPELANGEISESMINVIAEAAQEIKEEIETELIGGSNETSEDNELIEAENFKNEKEINSSNELHVEHKDSERDIPDGNVTEHILEIEKPKEEAIDIVMEQSSEAPAANLEFENLSQTEKIIEPLQVNGHVEGSDIQAGQEVVQQSEEIVNKIEENLSNGNSPLFMEFTQIAEGENENTKAESLEDENKQEDLQIEHTKNEEYQATILSEDQELETNEKMQDGTEVKTDIKSEDQKIDQTDNRIQVLTETENGQSEEIKAEDISFENQGEKNHFEEGHEGEAQTDDETQTAKAEIENISNEMQASSLETQPAEEFTPSESVLENMEPMKAESLLESQTIVESQNTEVIKPEIENTKEDINAAAVEEIQKEESATISTVDDSQLLNEFDKADEEIIPAEDLVVSGELQQQQVHEVTNAENIAAAEEEAPVESESLVAEDAQETQNYEEPTKEIQSSEETQSIDAIQSIEEAESIEEIDDTEELQHTQDDRVKEGEASQTAEEDQHYQETQSGEGIQPAEVTQTAEQTQFAEDAQVEFNIDSNPLEDIPIDDLIVEAPHLTDVGTHTQVVAAEPVEAVNADLEPLEGITSEVAPNESEAEIVSPLEENKAHEYGQALLPQPEIEEFAAEQQKPESVEAKPLETLAGELIVEESTKNDEDTTNSPQNNSASVEDNQNEKLNETTAEIQKPLEDKDSDNKDDKINESEPIKDTTSMLTTIVQVPIKEHLTTQQLESEQEQQMAIVATASSTTLKPLDVLDSAHNYVNVSFINQMGNDSSSSNIENDNNNNNNRQEVKEKEQVFNSKLRRYDGAQVWRIVVQNDKERKLADELQTKFDGQLWKEVKQEVDYLLRPQVLADAEQHVRAANLSRIVLIDNLQNVIEVENPPPERIAQLQNRRGCRLTWEAYHRLDDIHAFFDYLAKSYPDICTVETIGYSIEKRPLKILKISNGSANNSGIWIDGGMHAREWVTPAVVTYIANHITEGWDELPAYMRNINWYLHAVANPDGYEYSHTTDRLWRKNMRSHGRACPGVDLNRNFGYKWGGKGTSANPCSQTYRGSKAFSEPETFYISKFISNFPRETFKAYLSFHSYGQYILYPWGYDYHVTNDMADLDLVARKAGTIITKNTGAKFTVGSSATTLYPAAGGSDDWAKGIAGIKYSYTIEMGDTGRYGFILPAEYIEPNGKNGLTFAQSVAKAITLGKNGRRRKLKFHKTH